MRSVTDMFSFERRKSPLMWTLLAGIALVPVVGLAVGNDRPATETAPAPAVTAPAVDTTKRVENYLNGIQSLRATFIQEAPDGSVSEGTLSLERPGKLRFEYQPEVPLLIVADGSTLTFIDYDIKQVTRWPIGDTALGILVAKDIVLGGKLDVKTVTEAGQIRVTVIDPARRDEGFITLILEDKPLALKAWEVTDAQGMVTRVTLLDTVYNTPLDKKLFTFKDPRPTPVIKRGPRG